MSQISTEVSNVLDESLNPTEVNSFYSIKLLGQNEQEAGDGQIF